MTPRVLLSQSVQMHLSAYSNVLHDHAKLFMACSAVKSVHAFVGHQTMISCCYLMPIFLNAGRVAWLSTYDAIRDSLLA